MQMAQQFHQRAYDKRIQTASQSVSTGQYVYIDRPPMTAPSPERIETDLTSKLMSPKLTHLDSPKFRQVQY